MVSQETSASEKRKPSKSYYIPDVCRDLGVPCINLLGLMGKKRWRFSVLPTAPALKKETVCEGKEHGMIENSPMNVSAAFEMLLEEIEAEVDFVNRIGARALEGREYDKAREALDRAATLTAFRDKVAALRKEWDTMAAAADRAEDEESRSQRRNMGRLRKGLRTPEEAYYRPILRALAEAGGSAPMRTVLDRVQQLMNNLLKDVDFEPLASDPDMPRWRNAAQWARNSMVKEGFLRADSPRGVWAISDQGRKYLADQGGGRAGAGAGDG